MQHKHELLLMKDFIISLRDRKAVSDTKSEDVDKNSNNTNGLEDDLEDDLEDIDEDEDEEDDLNDTDNE